MLPTLLSTAALLLPAAGSGAGSAAAHAAEAAAAEVCRCIALVATRGSLHRDAATHVLAQVALQPCGCVSAGFAAALRQDSVAPASVKIAACHALAALLLSAAQARALLCIGDSDDEIGIPGTVPGLGSDQPVGKVIAQGLLTAASLLPSAAAIHQHTAERSPLAQRTLPQQQSAQHTRTTDAGSLLRVQTALAAACVTALRPLLAFSASTKEFVLEAGTYIAWVDKATAPCAVLASAHEDEVRTVRWRMTWPTTHWTLSCHASLCRRAHAPRLQRPTRN